MSGTSTYRLDADIGDDVCPNAGSRCSLRCWRWGVAAAGNLLSSSNAAPLVPGTHRRQEVSLAGHGTNTDVLPYNCGTSGATIPA